jgi:hypothetical protein
MKTWKRKNACPSYCCWPICVNNIKPLNVAMETRELVPFALLSSYRMLRPALNNINVILIFCVPLTLTICKQYKVSQLACTIFFSLRVSATVNIEHLLKMAS